MTVSGEPAVSSEASELAVPVPDPMSIVTNVLSQSEELLELIPYSGVFSRHLYFTNFHEIRLFVKIEFLKIELTNKWAWSVIPGAMIESKQEQSSCS